MKQNAVNLAFAKRLSDAMDIHPRCPEGYGRNTWLKRELEEVGVNVSLETIRKWLAGEVLPRRPKIGALAKALRIDETWLAMGAQPVFLQPRDSKSESLEAALRQIRGMTDDERIQAVIATALAPQNVG